MKHTPGPWKVDCTDGAQWPTKGLLESYAISPMAKSLPEIESNARLIAAAPELLASLKLLVAACACIDGEETWDTVKLARKVIEKAEGK